MTEQVPEPTVVTVIDEKPPSAFKLFRTNHPRLTTAVGTLIGAGAFAAIVAAVKSSKNDASLDEYTVDTTDLDPAGSDAPSAKDA